MKNCPVPPLPRSLPAYRTLVLLPALLLTLTLNAPAHADGSDDSDAMAASDKKSIDKPLIKLPKEVMAAKADAVSKADMANKADVSATSASNPKEVGAQLRAALGTSIAGHKKLTMVVAGKPGPAYEEATAAHDTSPQYRQARNAALGRLEALHMPARAAEAAWSYDGENGPQNWARLKPEYSLCGSGRRQSPINIDEDSTLQGPAEPIQYNYQPSRATVVNDGHTILVNVEGANTMVVRGSTYRLVALDFHAPSEMQFNYKVYPMSVNLVHRNDEGQLAILSVMLETGNANPLVDKVWTYLPLDTADRVRMPGDLLNVNEILPADQRYYQFLGSTTTPPCAEGVLWIVIKQPLQVSSAQYRLFTQLFPMNARPLQTLYGRPVREAQ